MEQHRLVVTEQSRNVKYSTGNRASNAVITVCGVGGVLGLLGDHFASYINV